MRHHPTETPMPHHVTETLMRHHVTEAPMRHILTETPMVHHVTETPMRHHVSASPPIHWQAPHIAISVVSPVPKINQATGRKVIKRGKTCIITDSPYKTALEDKGKRVTCPQPNSSSSKKRGLPKADKTSKKNKKKKEDSSTTPCLCGSELYSNSRRGESWVPCGECGQWTHREYAGYELGGFMCEICVDD